MHLTIHATCPCVAQKIGRHTVQWKKFFRSFLLISALALVWVWSGLFFFDWYLKTDSVTSIIRESDWLFLMRAFFFSALIFVPLSFCVAVMVHFDELEKCWAGRSLAHGTVCVAILGTMGTAAIKSIWETSDLMALAGGIAFGGIIALILALLDLQDQKQDATKAT